MRDNSFKLTGSHRTNYILTIWKLLQWQKLEPLQVCNRPTSPNSSVLNVI